MIRQKLNKFIQIGGCVALLVLSGGVSAGSVCEGDQKIEGSSDHTYTPGGEQVIEEVCVKAGREAFEYQCGDTDVSECYRLEWEPDCTSVTITGGGTGRDCKSISHSAAIFGEPGEPPKCEETNKGVEICDGIDNDCDGFIDEDVKDCKI